MLVDLGPLPKRPDSGIGMRQRQLAPLRIHDVEIKFIRQPLIKLHRLGIKANPRGGEVIGANDRCIACCVAAAQVGLLEHRNIRDAVILGEVIRGRHAVSPATDNHHVIVRLEISGAG